ncbi:hypothetical protein GCM10027271_41990 [Saccharopolyspora gloriosae]|uniref:Uncharacterized protein n=1 Tax=Saccharopolyspora gloriosae TaxID=455344 RepID=A0A840NND3_9PSEU|nr:hypothetical protein [Saccharopolyspora gloriosae]MBB5070789.1 hypothetical protein [Saccharopolyspora gloriosae]
MSVAERLGASLVARSEWCAPDEPVWWASWVEGVTFQVDGLDAEGKPNPGAGKRLAGAVGKAGMGVAVGALTAAFGGGENYESRSGPTEPGLQVFATGVDSDAVRLIQRTPPASAGSMLWVLTPRRLGVLLPLAEEVTEPAEPESGGWRQLARGLSEAGRSLVSSRAEFGANEPDAPMRSPSVAPWFELGPDDVVGCRSIGRENFPTHCGVVLRDGSGFAVRSPFPWDVEAMMSAVQAFNRGQHWSGRA